MALNFEDQSGMERLFILELLVDNLCINYGKTDLTQGVISSLRKLSVRFHFLDFPPVDVGEDDFCNITNPSQNAPKKFKSGKSVIFSLQDINPNSVALKVGVEVFGHGETINELLVARTCIALGEYFKQVLDSVYAGCNFSPTTRAAKNTYPLIGENGVDVGKITVFVRVSCFGKVEMGSKGPCVDLGGIGDKGQRPEPRRSQPALDAPWGDAHRGQYAPREGDRGSQSHIGSSPYLPYGRHQEHEEAREEKKEEKPSRPCVEDEEVPVDPNKDKDVLVLRIGNKDKPWKPPKLLVELKTPKIKFDEVKMEARHTQYLEEDIAATKGKDKGKDGKKKGKGKDKGKKKGKGKKGKK